MNTLELLKAAKALIDTPDKWCQLTMHTYDGRHCSIGAIENVGIRHGVRDYSIWHTVHLLDMASADHGAECIAGYNDTHTHEEVMAVWDEAIAAEEARALAHAKA